MKRILFMLAALMAGFTAPVQAETVLRTDEVAVGEMDPNKG